ncbi:phosphotransferase [Streptomyces sp. NPDC051001]|uniref:phosphotransferase n=1 Tax=Streptomyces sp. NPDC051001 TaxID=3155795 RepID=UPI00342D4813
MFVHGRSRWAKSQTIFADGSRRPGSGAWDATGQPGWPSHPDFAEVMELVGREAAAPHEHARLWTRPDIFTRPGCDLDNLIGAASLWGRWVDNPHVFAIPGDADTLARAEAKAARELATHGRGEDVCGLLHGDLRAANLLVAPDAVRLIDLDDCGTGWFLYDLACSLSFVEHDPRADGWLAAWLRGYASRRPPRDEDIRIIPALVMLRRLRQIVQGVQLMTERGQVRRDGRLSPERDLSRHFGASRTTGAGARSGRRGAPDAREGRWNVRSAAEPQLARLQLESTHSRTSAGGGAAARRRRERPCPPAPPALRRGDQSRVHRPGAGPDAFRLTAAGGSIRDRLSTRLGSGRLRRPQCPGVL